MALFLASFLLLNIDRSRSVYLLKWIGANSTNDFVTMQVIVEKYHLSFEGKAALEQRIAEQRQASMVKIEGEKLSLTTKGKVFLMFSMVFAKVFRLNGFLKA
jgi:hypothetical protein